MAWRSSAMPGPRRVLVLAAAHGGDGGVEHLAGTVGVGEALTEVDRAGGRGERRHLGEDRGAEALELAAERCGAPSASTLSQSSNMRRTRWMPDGSGSTRTGTPGPRRHHPLGGRDGQPDVAEVDHRVVAADEDEVAGSMRLVAPVDGPAPSRPA